MAVLITKEQFSELIEERVLKESGTTYIDAVLITLNRLKIPIEEFNPKLLTKQILTKMREEGHSLNLLKKTV